MTPQDKEVLQSFIATEIEKDEFYCRWPDYEREHPDHRIGDPYSIGVAVGVSRIKKKLEKFLRLDEDFVDSICERISINPPYLDGDSWCILIGSDIQSGICGFGRTKFEALMDFIKAIILQTKKLTSNVSSLETQQGVDVDEFLDEMRGREPDDDDLAKEINAIHERYPEISFAKLSRICVRIANWQKKQIMKDERNKSNIQH